ncbi:MAG: type I-C CRISPR-associated protein Cas7/Csd2 [Deltaproteobacteria bacterium]|nr:type I-C CRISPR-associated protein Cas7/Csd2 [Deltaproteobacteria bacterium]
MSESIRNRYEFVLLFDVKDGNPNGDPDAGNLPRIDPETGNGLVTDVCLKRKVRNYVGLVKDEQPPFEIYVKERAILNKQHERAYVAIGEDLGQSNSKRKGDNVEAARAWMCKNFFDVRTFGAVMSTGVNCGQVRGPVQIGFGRSVERVFTAEHSITRMAVATEAEAEKQKGDNRTIGRKFTIPYALYRTHGFISAPLARQTGFSDEDLSLFWDALLNMFDHDRSAARGEMATQKLIVFKHASELGNAPAHKLFELVSVERTGDPNSPARTFADYEVIVDSANKPEGVEVIEML